MNKQKHKDYLYCLARYYNKFDNNIIQYIQDYIDSIPEDIELTEDIEDYRAKNAYRYAYNSIYGKSKKHWDKIKNYICNEKK